MKRVFILFIMVLLTACSDKTKEAYNISSAIFTQLKQSEWKTVEFSKAVPFKFDKVCLFGPYSTNEGAEKILGFSWNMELKTPISSNDGINVIAFVKDNKVISYVEHPRNQGDFWRLSSKCFDYKNTKLTRTSKKDKWTYRN